ncbi:Protein NYNRIN [Trichinella sp. T8]|nr:Protein NYNRIN [Trichinella sp. T8]
MGEQKKNQGDDDSERSLLVVLSKWVPDVLQPVHDSPEAGHLGVEKILERLRRRFYWPGQREYVADWCASCDDCAQRKISTKAPLQP